MLASIRVALVALPQLLRDIVTQAISDAEGISIVGEYATCDDWRILAAGAEVVLVSVGASRSVDTCDELLYRAPRTRVVAVEGNRGRVTVYQLRPEEALIGELSPSELIEVIRAAAGTTSG